MKLSPASAPPPAAKVPACRNAALPPAGRVKDLPARMALEDVRALSYAPTIPLMWPMYAGVVDEWKGRHITGVMYATIRFGLKTGLGVGGAMAGWLLWGSGYHANAVQTADSLRGIRTISLFPAMLFALVIICKICYKIGRELNIQTQQDELAERYKGLAQAG
jgi:Na+/melibiose symporter-like transporter